MKEIKRLENFPNDGEAYVVGEKEGRYYFAWGSEYPFADEFPNEDVRNGENGIEWFISERAALESYNNAVEAMEDTRAI